MQPTDFNEFSNRINLGELQAAADKIRAEVGKVIVGQSEMIDLMITAVLADGHILLEGVPGVAKTLTAKLLAKTLNVGFSRIQFTPDLMPSDVVGTSVYNQKENEFEFKHGPVFSNVVLIDEINRAPAKTQAALFECMQEKQITFDGVTYLLQAPFLVLATQNPIEQEGTYRLPEAQLDRFLFKVNIGYPSLEEEVHILEKHHTGDPLQVEISSILTADEIEKMRAQIRLIHVEPKLLQYIASIVNQTRDNRSLMLGASPRASVALLNSAKAYAAINGRDFVTPDDIKFLAVPVLRHRIVLAPEREMEGSNADQVVKELIDTVEVPR